MLEQESQSTGWHHIVMSIYVSRVTNLGPAVMYFDGEKIGQNRLDDSMYNYGGLYMFPKYHLLFSIQRKQNNRFKKNRLKCQMLPCQINIHRTE